MATYKELEPLSKQFTIVVGLAVVGFMAMGLALSFYRNVLFDDRLREMASDNDLLEQKIEKGRQDLEYFRSIQYKDKYAKMNLSLLSPGEKVLIISKRQTDETSIGEEFLTPSERQQIAYEEYLRQIPIVQHWSLFLFHRNRIVQLQKGIVER